MTNDQKFRAAALRIAHDLGRGFGVRTHDRYARALVDAAKAIAKDNGESLSDLVCREAKAGDE